MGDAHPREDEILSRDWFYPFRLPSGRLTPTYDQGRLNAVHDTRLAMMDQALAPVFGGDYGGASCIDLACHQGYFSLEMARRGCQRVVGIDARQSHVDDANLMAEVQGHGQFQAFKSDVHAVDTTGLGRFDLVLMLGLIYHLENPIGALRVAEALTGRVCVVETQVVPGMSGHVDWGNHQFVKALKGSFGIIDETDETHGPEASTLGICLAPSTEGLMWIMEKIGFDRVELIAPPEGAYEQHRFGKRVLVAGYRDAG